MTGRRGPLSDSPHLRSLKTGETAGPAGKPPPPAPPEGHGRPRFAAPAWLSVEAKRLFADMVRDIEAAWPGTLARIDIPAIAFASENYAIAIGAAEAMRSDKGNHTVVVDGDRTNENRPRKSPAWQVYREAQAAYVALAKEYGLTLSARLRLELDSGLPEGDDAEDAADEIVG